MDGHTCPSTSASISSQLIPSSEDKSSNMFHTLNFFASYLLIVIGYLKKPKKNTKNCISLAGIFYILFEEGTSKSSFSSMANYQYFHRLLVTLMPVLYVDSWMSSIISQEEKVSACF